MTDLIDEVSADFENEKFIHLTKKLSKVFITVAVIILTITIFFTWHKKSLVDLNLELTDKFYQANLLLDKNNATEAQVYFDSINKYTDQQITAIALLHQSAWLLKNGQKDQALAQCKTIMENKHYDLALRELAILNYLQMDFDNLTIEKFDQLATKITLDDKPWRISALQLKAMLLIKFGELKQAEDILNKILLEKNISKAGYDITQTILNNLQFK